jgi:NADH pyrophosphatase NudC (nudix superfamily)
MDKSSGQTVDNLRTSQAAERADPSDLHWFRPHCRRSQFPRTPPAAVTLLYNQGAILLFISVTLDIRDVEFS